MGNLESNKKEEKKKDVNYLFSFEIN